MILNSSQQYQVKNFTRAVFDVRLKIALDNQKFASMDIDEKKKRAQEWLRHYGKVILKLLDPTIAFNEGYPEVLKVMADESKYYRHIVKGEYKGTDGEELDKLLKDTHWEERTINSYRRIFIL